MYQITEHTRDRAKQIGVEVKISTNPKKKIDVFKHGKKVASIGALGYNDFTTFSRQSPAKARARQKAYHSRHRKDESKKGSPGYYAAKLLW